MDDLFQAFFFWQVTTNVPTEKNKKMAAPEVSAKAKELGALSGGQANTRGRRPSSNLASAKQRIGLDQLWWFDGTCLCACRPPTVPCPP